MGIHLMPPLYKLAIAPFVTLPVTMRPMGNGDLQEAAYQYPVSGFHWDKVCEVVADGESTKIYHGWRYDYRELYRFLPILPTTPITSVTVHIVSKMTNPYGYGNTRAPLIKTKGELYYPTLLGHSAIELWEEYPNQYSPVGYTWATNPFTGNPWTVAEVNALQAGAYCVSDASYGDGVHLTQVYVVVS